MEVESILSREKVARTVLSVVGGTIEQRTDPEEPDALFWLIEAPDGRVWKVEDDESLQVPADERAEFVTPILVEGDLELLSRVIDAVRAAGASVNDHCGVHVHVGTANCTVEHINRAIDLLIVLEPIVIERMLGIHEHRRQFAALMSKEFIDQFKQRRPQSLKELRTLWGGPEYDERRWRNRFDAARYKGFNLHSHALRDTVEFRYFNGTLDSQRIAEYVRFCLGVAEQAGFPDLPEEDS